MRPRTILGVVLALLFVAGALGLSGCCVEPADCLCPGDPCQEGAAPCDPCRNGGEKRFWTPIHRVSCCWWQPVPCPCADPAPLPSACAP